MRNSKRAPAKGRKQPPDGPKVGLRPAQPSPAGHPETQARIELAAIVESSDDAILSKDLNGTIHSWNKGAQRIYGYSAAEMIGRHISSLLPPNYPDDTVDIMQRLRRGERIEHYETKRQAKNGDVLSVSLTISPIRELV